MIMVLEQGNTRNTYDRGVVHAAVSLVGTGRLEDLDDAVGYTVAADLLRVGIAGAAVGAAGDTLRSRGSEDGHSGGEDHGELHVDCGLSLAWFGS